MINLLDINPGDILLVASDVTRLAYKDPEFSCDKLIDELQEAVGPEGTLLFPTYNMDFCDGVPFDIIKTPSQMGSLSSAALKRADFGRTQHPIYSFAVWGKYKEWFVSMNSETAWEDMAVIDKMLMIDVDYQHSFTYAHHIEDLYRAKYRYDKVFFTEEQGGNAWMYVRNLEDRVESDLNKIGKILEGKGAAEYYSWWEIPCILIYLDRAAHLIKKDILLNRGRNLHKDKYTELESYFDRLWPIMRSITGDGVRDTHKILSLITPLETIEIPSGTKVFDWVVPDEWEYIGAFIDDMEGRSILTSANSLHLVNYSDEFCGYIKRDELMKHLHSIPEKPTVIPYKTAYYNREWGFCVSDYQKQRMTDEIYFVNISTHFKKGSMTISDLVIPGETDEEIMFSTYTCHPSMANNELSGPLAVAFLARMIKEKPRHYTYRFVFIPETIGSLAYMATQDLSKVIAGYVVTCCGVDKPFVYKRTKAGFSITDDVAEYVFKDDGFEIINNGPSRWGMGVRTHPPAEIRDFYPDKGADERQYNYMFPCGTIMTCPPEEYSEYHTSLDNKDFISFRAIQRTIDSLYSMCVDVFEINRIYKNNYTGEPSFKKHDITEDLDAVRWLLSKADGYTDLLTISNESDIKIDRLAVAAKSLEEKGVLEIV